MKPLNKNKLTGRFRLLFNNCPACNSDSPEIYDCVVCSEGEIRYSDEKENARRWYRFLCYLEILKGKPKYPAPLNIHYRNKGEESEI